MIPHFFDAQSTNIRATKCRCATSLLSSCSVAAPLARITWNAPGPRGAWMSAMAVNRNSCSRSSGNSSGAGNLAVVNQAPKVRGRNLVTAGGSSRRRKEKLAQAAPKRGSKPATPTLTIESETQKNEIAGTRETGRVERSGWVAQLDVRTAQRHVLDAALLCRERMPQLEPKRRHPFLTISRKKTIQSGPV